MRNLDENEKRIVKLIVDIYNDCPDNRVDMQSIILKYLSKDIGITFRVINRNPIISYFHNTRIDNVEAYKQLRAFENDVAHLHNMIEYLLEHNWIFKINIDFPEEVTLQNLNDTPPSKQFSSYNSEIHRLLTEQFKYYYIPTYGLIDFVENNYETISSRQFNESLAKADRSIELTEAASNSAKESSESAKESVRLTKENVDLARESRDAANVSRDAAIESVKIARSERSRGWLALLLAFIIGIMSITFNGLQYSERDRAKKIRIEKSDLDLILGKFDELKLQSDKVLPEKVENQEREDSYQTFFALKSKINIRTDSTFVENSKKYEFLDIGDVFVVKEKHKNWYFIEYFNSKTNSSDSGWVYRGERFYKQLLRIQ